MLRSHALRVHHPAGGTRMAFQSLRLHDLDEEGETNKKPSER